MIFLTGTKGNTWREFAEQVSATAPNTSVDDAYSESLTRALTSKPEVNLLIFAEQPATLIAAGVTDPSATLNGWKESGATLLAVWRKNRHRVTILNWEECAANPDSTDKWFGHRFGTEFGAIAEKLPSPAETSLAKRIIAEAIVSSDREAKRLWGELQAASQPICDKAAGSPALSPERALEELAQAVSAHEDLVTRLAALGTELELSKRRSIENSEMLLREIQNAHKESEDFFEQWKSLEASAGAHHLVAERVLRGSEKHQPPHSHLDYVFESASLLDRHWRQLPVRLVEHNGKAGLALFRPFGSTTAPLYHWKPSGQEGGLDYMLFVPSDKRPAAKLAGLPASDLLLVRDAAAKILGHLSVHEGSEPNRWLPVARRLLREIEEIPERLHYDSVAGFSHRENNQTSIRFNAANLYYRGNCARSFVFDWAPASSGGTLRFAKCTRNTSLFLAAPSEVAVGFASAEDRETVKKLWPKLTAHDRTFLLLLAKALPDFVFHLCEQHPDQKPHKDRLTKQARKLYSRLRNLDRKHKFKAALAQSVR